MINDTKTRLFFVLAYRERLVEEGKQPVVDKLDISSIPAIHDYYYIDEGNNEVPLSDKIGNATLPTVVQLDGKDYEIVEDANVKTDDDGSVKCVPYPVCYTVDYKLNDYLFRKSFRQYEELRKFLINSNYESDEVRYDIFTALFQSLKDKIEEGDYEEYMGIFKTLMRQVMMGKFDTKVPGSDYSMNIPDKDHPRAEPNNPDKMEDDIYLVDKTRKTGLIQTINPEEDSRFKVVVDLNTDVKPYCTVLLVGLPGAGKTTFIKHLKETFEGNKEKQFGGYSLNGIIASKSFKVDTFRKDDKATDSTIDNRLMTVSARLENGNKEYDGEFRFYDTKGEFWQNNPKINTIWHIGNPVIRNVDCVLFFHYLIGDSSASEGNETNARNARFNYQSYYDEIDASEVQDVYHIYTHSDELTDKDKIEILENRLRACNIDVGGKDARGLVKAWHYKYSVQCADNDTEKECNLPYFSGLNSFNQVKNQMPIAILKILAEKLKNKIEETRHPDE